MADGDTIFTHMGAFEVERDGKRLVTARGIAEDADPSPIGRSIGGAVTDRLRIAEPMVRAGYLDKGPASRERRGGEPFVPVSWPEATRLVAEAIERVRAAHGNEAIFGGSYGWASAGRFHHAQSQLHRFLNMAGGYTRSVNTYSYAAAEVLLPHILGDLSGLAVNHTPWEMLAEHARLIVMFGGMPLKNAQVSAGGVARHTVRDSLRRCREAGVEFVNIGPIPGDADPMLEAEYHWARPNSDTAIMLGMAHTLLERDLHDRAFLDRYTTGFERFRAYLAGETDGQAKDAAWASAISGLAAATIRDLALRMAATRSMVTVSWSLQRADHGEQPLWAAIALAAMLGQIGLPGGGFAFGYGGANRIGQAAHEFSFPALDQGRNPVRTLIPVARVSDMLLEPGGRFDFNGERLTYPDIRLVYWAGGNPFHHQQDLNKLVRAWQRPETVVVHEIWWNALARHADIVLPTTTSMERNDLGISTGEGYLFAMKRLIDPVGAARSDHDILADIAGHLGFRDAFTEDRGEMEWVRYLYLRTGQRVAEHGMTLPPFEEFWRDGRFKLPPPAQRALFEAFRADPERAPLPTPSGRIEIFSERIASFGYDDCPGHPAWIEPAEWLGSPKASQFPLHLISNQPSTRLHSQYDNGVASRESKVAGREPIRIHPEDAEARGIRSGDVVRVFNDRGACLAGAVVTDAVSPRIVQMATGAWYDPEEPGRAGSLERHGNPNVLTMDKGTSRLGQAPIAHSALVQVERFEGEAPPVGIHEPPPILR